MDAVQVLTVTVKLASPQAAFAYVLEGHDPWCLAVAPPPTFSSAQEAAELVSADLGGIIWSQGTHLRSPP